MTRRFDFNSASIASSMANVAGGKARLTLQNDANTNYAAGCRSGLYCSMHHLLHQRAELRVNMCTCRNSVGANGAKIRYKHFSGKTPLVHARRVCQCMGSSGTGKVHMVYRQLVHVPPIAYAKVKLEDVYEANFTHVSASASTMIEMHVHIDVLDLSYECTDVVASAWMECAID